MKAFHLFTSYFVSSSSEKNTLSFIETSALDSTNVEEAFKNILTGRKSDELLNCWCNVQPTVNLHGNVILNFTALTFTVFSHRNLPYRISEANIRQIRKRWVSRKQRSGHKPPPNLGRAKRQQTPLLPKPVTLMFSSLFDSVSVFPLFTSGLLQLSCCCHHDNPHGFRSFQHQDSCIWHSFFCWFLSTFFSFLGMFVFLWF